MAKKFKATQYEKQLIAADEYAARIVAIVDLGTQTTSWKGEEKKAVQCKVIFELVDYSREWTNKEGETVEGNALLSKTYSQTMSKNGNFYKLVKAALGRKLTEDEENEFDPEELLNKPVWIDVTEEVGENGAYKKISDIMKVSKEDKITAAENEPYAFWLDKDADWELFDKIPEWLQKIVMLSPEYSALKDREEEAPKRKKADAAPKRDAKKDLGLDDDEEDAPQPAKGAKRKVQYDDED